MMQAVITAAAPRAATAVILAAALVALMAPRALAASAPRSRHWWYDETAMALVPRPASPREHCRLAPSRTAIRRFAAARSAGEGSNHWAVLIGVNHYAGNTSDTIGSVADALMLCDVLLDHGWRRDHILVLTDRAATRDGVTGAIRRLARKSDEHSTVVFSFSGHMQHRGTEAALWLADNAYLWGPEFGELLRRVEAERMWVTLQGCHSAGLRARGLEGEGRVVTYSSRADQKSFDDLSVGYSVQGRYLFVQGLRRGWADGDGDGRVSVQEAHRWLRPRAARRTSGRQHPVIVDGLGEPFLLDVY